MKGVIIAAGYGTRFFPVTKTIPKEMLPIITRPAIDFIVEEFRKSGIKEILIITSRRKKSMEDYFDHEIELENVLTAKGAHDKVMKILPPEEHFYFVRQKEMKGTGDAILLAKSFTGNDPFIVAYPDDIHFGDEPLSLQLINFYKKTGCSVLTTIHNPRNLERYGIIAPAPDNLHVSDIIEKPAPGKEPSKEATIGRYLFTPELYKPLEEGYAKHKEGEYYHIGAIRTLAKSNRLVFMRAAGKHLDIGAPSGYLEAILTYAQLTDEYKEIISKFYG
ncbi:MAG: NTP transferase domain-containing protein [Spirochaetales bacterium]|nr:NTP transferase domain-containing protein [Spirochaetales bacterium]